MYYMQFSETKPLFNSTPVGDFRPMCQAASSSPKHQIRAKMESVALVQFRHEAVLGPRGGTTPT